MSATPDRDAARKEQIRAQAKQIMDSFFVALNNAQITNRQIGVNRSRQTRQPKSVDRSESFRDALFTNAPSKDIDHIIAERKSW